MDKQNGCQKSDADAYCKLKLCRKDAISENFRVTTWARVGNQPGFSCNGVYYKEPSFGTDYGTWFGMDHVHYNPVIPPRHRTGDAVSSVRCKTQGKYKQFHNKGKLECPRIPIIVLLIIT